MPQRVKRRLRKELGGESAGLDLTAEVAFMTAQDACLPNV
jgi:hypothetical protein